MLSLVRNSLFMRLKSLDILRGLDLLFLLMVGPLYRSFYSCCRPDSPFLHWLKVQMNHVKWEGFVAWDIIMPLFMFMSGITIPFSMSKYRNGLTPDRGFYLKLLRRFVLLFVFGWLVQGNLLTLDPKLFHPFANTLQAIAVGYAASALMFVHLRPKGQIVATVILFLAYLAAFVAEIDRRSVAMHSPKSESGEGLSDRFVAMVFEASDRRASIGDYAERLGVSAGTLYRAVKRSTGKTPLAWIDEAVVSEAKALLSHTDLTVNEIAARVGILDPSYFSRFFRKQVGLTPIDFREKMKKSHQ